MQNFIQDLVETIGLQPQHFDLLIILVIVVGGIWAAVRLYQDFTRPLDTADSEQEQAKHF